MTRDGLPVTDAGRRAVDAIKGGALALWADDPGDPIAAMIADVESAAKEELQATFDLRWAADMRAIKRWQEAHPGNELTWPDHADLVVWLLEELERLRRQNHDHAERRDREDAVLRSEVDRWRSAAARAREMVRGSPVDWTNDPGSKKPDGWWSYTSEMNRTILTAAVADLREAAKLDHDRLARAMNDVEPHVCTAARLPAVEAERVAAIYDRLPDE